MTTALVAAFLMVHGLLHLGVWSASPPPGPKQPFDPAHSWALTMVRVGASPAKVAAVSLACATTVLYVIAGAAVAVDGPDWALAALIAAACGLVLKAMWFHPWLTLGLLLDAGVIVAVAASWPAALF